MKKLLSVAVMLVSLSAVAGEPATLGVPGFGLPTIETVQAKLELNQYGNIQSIEYMSNGNLIVTRIDGDISQIQLNFVSQTMISNLINDLQVSEIITTINGSICRFVRAPEEETLYITQTNLLEKLVLSPTHCGTREHTHPADAILEQKAYQLKSLLLALGLQS